MFTQQNKTVSNNIFLILFIPFCEKISLIDFVVVSRYFKGCGNTHLFGAVWEHC